jgi:hypothetical protein
VADRLGLRSSTARRSKPPRNHNATTQAVEGNLGGFCVCVRGTSRTGRSSCTQILGCLFSLDLLQALILSLRIADSLGQHLAQLSLGLCGFALGWLPLGHISYVGMPEAELNPRLGLPAAHPCPATIVSRKSIIAVEHPDHRPTVVRGARYEGLTVGRLGYVQDDTGAVFRPDRPRASRSQACDAELNM